MRKASRAATPVPEIIGIDNTLFADCAHLLGATGQVGSDLVITYDNAITLKAVTPASFTSAEAVLRA